jgi:hypothetical protein
MKRERLKEEQLAFALRPLLRRVAWLVDTKREWLLYAEEERAIRMRQPRRRRAWRYREGRQTAGGPNVICMKDFVPHGLFGGRPFRPLTVLDCRTREAFAIKSSANVRALQVAEVLESIQDHIVFWQSLLTIIRTDAQRRYAWAFRFRHSQSLLRRRHRFSQAIVRSTIQRLGSTTNLALSQRRTISIFTVRQTRARPRWNFGPWYPASGKPNADSMQG